MKDLFKITYALMERLLVRYGDPLANYQRTKNDMRMTYYVSKLMEVRGHEYIIPQGKDRAYFTEQALHEAFLAGQLIGKANRVKRSRRSLKV
jgi:hypothetical protein